MRKKHIYRSAAVEAFDQEALWRSLDPGQQVVVAIDVAKTKFIAAFGDRSCTWLRLVKWEHPRQVSDFLALLEVVKSRGHEVVVVLEPTGTYGDALRYQLGQRGIEVHRASTKHVHDAAELYDGVPSKHDAKDAAILLWLYSHGRTTKWLPIDEDRRKLRALVDERELFEVPLRRATGKLEALLARHFPELERVVDVSRRPSVWSLLQAWPSPKHIAAHAAEARALLARESRGKFADGVVEGIVQAATSSCGQPLEPGDERLLRRLLAEMRRCEDEISAIDGELAELTAAPEVAALRKVLGPVTLAVVLAYVGSPKQYPSATAFEKACGLNLREHSSGTHQGKLRITKRGPGIVRRYLHLATLRLIQREPLVRTWYERRGGYRAESKMKAVTAVTRKLTRALKHLAQGAAFDATKLFDARRLALAPSSTASAGGRAALP